MFFLADYQMRLDSLLFCILLSLPCLLTAGEDIFLWKVKAPYDLEIGDLVFRKGLKGRVCIASSEKVKKTLRGSGRDLAWANADSREIHWLTLTPRIVMKIVNFKTGTFDDLKRAVESKLEISFRSDMVSKGEVRQRIADYETVEGETLRYFVDGPEGGEDFRCTVRKAINQHTIDCTPLQGGFGAVFANAFEDAMQGDENAKNARSPRFAPQGSLQLQFTRNAVKGNQGSIMDGNLDSMEGVINQLQNLSF